MTAPHHRPPLRDYWLAEAIRLREAHWGPLADADAVRAARQGPDDFEQRILLRAQALAVATPLPRMIERWRQGALAALTGLLLLAAMTGALTALGALGDGTRAVNILWALGALLGLHVVMGVLWLLSFFIRAPDGAGGLGRVWLWLSRKFARGPDAALVPHALFNLLAQRGALRALLGAVTHAIWFTALTVALITLLVVLSTASYRFIWATTLLAPDTFVALTRAIGWLPAQVGFNLPDAAFVRASDGTQALPVEAQIQWSIWLMGTVAVYGVLPRMLALVCCAFVALRGMRRPALDLTLPGYAGLHDKLLPRTETIGIDRPADAAAVTPIAAHTAAHRTADLGGRAVIVALEVPADIAWPPVPLPTAVHDGGALDTRQDRNRMLDALARTPAARLLIACDARQTPDRGTLSLIASLAKHAAHTAVWLLPSDAAPRRQAWVDSLRDAGMEGEAIVVDTGDAARWLETAHADA